MPRQALPVRTPLTNQDIWARPQRWKSIAPDGASRWALVRPAVIGRAEELGIRQDVLLKPLIQKQLAWQGWTSTEDMRDTLASLGAREWQIENVVPAIEAAIAQASE